MAKESKFDRVIAGDRNILQKVWDKGQEDVPYVSKAMRSLTEKLESKSKEHEDKINPIRSAAYKAGAKASELATPNKMDLALAGGALAFKGAGSLAKMIAKDVKSAKSIKDATKLVGKGSKSVTSSAHEAKLAKAETKEAMRQVIRENKSDVGMAKRGAHNLKDSVNGVKTQKFGRKALDKMDMGDVPSDFERLEIDINNGSGKANKRMYEGGKDAQEAMRQNMRNAGNLKDNTRGKVASPKRVEELRAKDASNTANVKLMGKFKKVEGGLIDQAGKDKANAFIKKRTTSEKGFTKRGKPIGEKIGDQGGSVSKETAAYRAKFNAKAEVNKARNAVSKDNKSYQAYKNSEPKNTTGMAKTTAGKNKGRVESMDSEIGGPEGTKQSIAKLRDKDSKNTVYNKIVKEKTDADMYKKNPVKYATDEVLPKGSKKISNYKTNKGTRQRNAQAKDLKEYRNSADWKSYINRNKK